MTLFKHEMRQTRMSLVIWTASIGFLMAICILLFPEMKGEMDGVSDMFASMGSFSAAFGMDRINFGSLDGFYAIECGNILGLGGAFFAAFCAVTVLGKEEKDHTAEFLLTHPVSRARIITEKLAAVLAQIVIMNVLTLAISIGSMYIVGEEIPWENILLMHLAYFLLQLEIGGICFGISAFVRRGGIGIGLGIAVMMYFLNIVANISDKAEFVKYITPFGFSDGADIITSGEIDAAMVSIGMAIGVIGIIAAYVKYTKKDIAG